jgi:hypothetical protein
MLAHMDHGKIASVKKNSGQKSTLTETDHHTLRSTVSKNQQTTAAQVTAELNNHIEDRFHKNCQM